MPAWPTQSDYKDALQNPDTAFRDPDLRASQAERSPMGVPRARSGAFASVYKMTGPKGVVALKLFNFPNEDRAQRYKAVSDYLELELGPRKPGCLVKFQYHLEGIRVGKGWYPTLTMPWVKGVSLGEWVRQTVERKTPDLAAVRKMSESWGAILQQLQDAKIAHGDLQHDNVMVVGDAPVLEELGLSFFKPGRGQKLTPFPRAILRLAHLRTLDLSSAALSDVPDLSAIAYAAASFISSLKPRARTSSAPRKTPGKASELFTWFG